MSVRQTRRQAAAAAASSNPPAAAAMNGNGAPVSSAEVPDAAEAADSQENIFLFWPNLIGALSHVMVADQTPR